MHHVKVLTATAVLALVLVTGSASASSRATAVPVGLETDNSPALLGSDNPAPRFTWRLKAGGRDVRQDAYEVVVTRGAEVVWSTGRVRSRDQQVTYDGPSLRSRTRYGWRVRVWDPAGGAPASERSWFETGPMSQDEWSAQWITGATAADCSDRLGGVAVPRQCVRPAPLLRSTFELDDKEIASARLYAATVGYSDFELNGRPVTDAITEPGFTDVRSTVPFVTHDVTGLLRRGANAVGVELGRGWTGVPTRDWIGASYFTASWHRAPAVRAELHVRFADGTEQVVRTDERWRTRGGPTTFDSIYTGETYDGRIAAEVDGWTTAAYDDSAWAPVERPAAPPGTLRAQTLEPVRTVERFTPAGRRVSVPGAIVVDAGRVLTGNLELRLPAGTPAGVDISVGYSEVADGNTVPRVLPELAYFPGQLQASAQYDHYVTAGSGKPETWSAKFSHKGFRYAIVTGLPPTATVELRVRQVRSSMAETSSFSSSEALVDRIEQATRASIEANLHSIPTDTPIYEKAGWLGDSNVDGTTMSYMMDMRRFWAKWMQDIFDTQAADGSLSQDLAPNSNGRVMGREPDPAWSGTPFTLVEEQLRLYGDGALGDRWYPELVKFYEYVTGKYVVDGVPSFGIYHDWTSAGPRATSDLLTGAYYIQWSRVLEVLAKRRGEDSAAQDFAHRGEAVAEALNRRYLNRGKGLYEGTPGGEYVQTDNALMLAMGVVPADQVGRVADSLAADVKARGDHLAVGVVGARFLFDVLSKHGHVDTALAIANGTTPPSYGFWLVVCGYTALGEGWGSATGAPGTVGDTANCEQRSHAHHMFGGIGQWFYEDLAGITPLRPGFEQVQVKPYVPAKMEHASATVETVRGRVSSSWRKTDRGLALEVEVPPGATGVVSIPATAASSVTESGQALDEAPGVRRLEGETGRVRVAVGSGTYAFLAAR